MLRWRFAHRSQHRLVAATNVVRARRNICLRFCGEPTGEWGPFEDGHFTTCFLQLFVFCPVYLVFVIGASLRMRELFTQGNSSPPRPLSSTQVARASRRCPRCGVSCRDFRFAQMLKIGLAVLMALYNLILFAVHLGSARP